MLVYCAAASLIAMSTSSFCCASSSPAAQTRMCSAEATPAYGDIPVAFPSLCILILWPANLSWSRESLASNSLPVDLPKLEACPVCGAAVKHAAV